MRAFLAFMKKEWMEQIRSSRLVVLTILFVLFGIMNPAIAKLTPCVIIESQIKFNMEGLKNVGCNSRQRKKNRPCVQCRGYCY